MVDKRSFRAKVYEVAEELGIEQTKVIRIISSYFDYCRHDLYCGRIVRILGFAYIEPNVIFDDFINTTAMYCKMVSENSNVTYHTVREVMRTYFEVCKADLLNGKSVDFRTLCTLHPIVDQENRVVKVHVSLSALIFSRLDTELSGVTSARAHLCKVFKNELRSQSFVGGVE